jgi:hypothetical protein
MSLSHTGGEPAPGEQESRGKHCKVRRAAPVFVCETAGAASLSQAERGPDRGNALAARYRAVTR